MVNRGVIHMRKKFNIAGYCNPDKHYMADLAERLEKIKLMVDEGEYFVINRARQYGKTTTLMALRQFLEKDYIVVSMDFQRQMSAKKFQDETVFSIAFAEGFLKKINLSDAEQSMEEKINELKEISHQYSIDFDLVKLFDSFDAPVLSETVADYIPVPDELEKFYKVKKHDKRRMVGDWVKERYCAIRGLRKKDVS